MLRSQSRRATWFAWLRVVAIRQAWEHCARSRSERPGGAFVSRYVNEIGAYEYPEPPADTPEVPDQVADHIQHVKRLADLAAIKPNERHTLFLLGLGYRYTEIMQITGASYTAVNRRITEGRRALRNSNASARAAVSRASRSEEPAGRPAWGHAVQQRLFMSELTCASVLRESSRDTALHRAGHASPGERRDLANALLRAACSAVVDDTRILLLDLLVEVDDALVEDVT